MSVVEGLARVMNRVYDRMRHPDAFKLRPEDAQEGSFESLRGNNYAVMVTFRRSGEAVPSPVWFGLGGPEEMGTYVEISPRSRGGSGI